MLQQQLRNCFSSIRLTGRGRVIMWLFLKNNSPKAIKSRPRLFCGRWKYFWGNFWGEMPTRTKWLENCRMLAQIQNIRTLYTHFFCKNDAPISLFFVKWCSSLVGAPSLRQINYSDGKWWICVSQVNFNSRTAVAIQVTLRIWYDHITA